MVAAGAAAGVFGGVIRGVAGVVVFGGGVEWSCLCGQSNGDGAGGVG